ncbi:MAG: Exopolyphosphatase [Candelina mexicana]|nr:MAG: Exopolyphosphatase [Candelina mexicana]
MAVPRDSLRSFLSTAKAVLHAAIENSQKVTIVIGNESADLDSLTSSIIFAYIRSSSARSTSRAPPFTGLYIPLTNIPAGDIRLRPEYTTVFRHANIDSSHLITIDDLPPHSSLLKRLKPENTKWILVDHNALQGYLGELYSERIGGVIDHHDEENKVPNDTGSEPRIIEKSGSCTSLVVNYCRSAWDDISFSSLSSGAAHAQGDSILDDSAVSRKWDAQVAKLAQASILIDTANLTSKSKVTSHDIRAVEYLEAKIKSSPQDAAEFDRKAFYDEINTAKAEIGSLELYDILRKDYKEWIVKDDKSLGISSVVKPLSFLQNKALEERPSNSQGGEPFLAILWEFAIQRGLAMFAIMTTSTSAGGDCQRELLVWALRREAVEAAKKFEGEAVGELGLMNWRSKSEGNLDSGDGDDGTWRRVWFQKEVGKSRKQVAPLLRKAMA